MFQVSSNGVLYFTAETRISFDNKLSDISGYVIAPFWASADQGEVYYRYPPNTCMH